MVRQTRKILLVLPWAEPDKWVFQNHPPSLDIDVCSVPELHVNRSIKGMLQSSLHIAKQLKTYDCVVSWEATAALATTLGKSLIRSSGRHIALGIIPKSNNQHLNRLLTLSLKRANLVTCFSKHDIGTIRDRFGVAVAAITPTVWSPSVAPVGIKTLDWLSVGASNRDDKTLARAAEISSIKVARYARHQTNTSNALDWHINADQRDVEDAFQNYRCHLAILSSSAYASGLSIAVRAGFANQLLIATDTPHMREVIRDGENGLLVRMGDSHHVADTIRMIQNGAVNSQKLADVLEDDCQQSHTYEVMRQHIASMVDMCF
jgi:hypothetical protein